MPDFQSAGRDVLNKKHRRKTCGKNFFVHKITRLWWENALFPEKI
ncbi:hypothetical protein CPTD_00487 [Corynebacterium pseudotuberculosis]|nr:hypothetical protein CPTD_00487 [Corynebacterium pseudotuberculosis]